MSAVSARSYHRSIARDRPPGSDIRNSRGPNQGTEHSAESCIFEAQFVYSRCQHTKGDVDRSKGCSVCVRSVESILQALFLQSPAPNAVPYRQADQVGHQHHRAGCLCSWMPPQYPMHRYSHVTIPASALSVRLWRHGGKIARSFRWNYPDQVYTYNLRTTLC